MMYSAAPFHLNTLLLWSLHAAGALLFTFGILFLLFWSFKHLSERDLWKWGWVLLLVGIALCLLTLIAGWQMGDGRYGMMGRDRMMKWDKANSEQAPAGEAGGKMMLQQQLKTQ